MQRSRPSTSLEAGPGERASRRLVSRVANHPQNLACPRTPDTRRPTSRRRFCLPAMAHDRLPPGQAPERHVAGTSTKRHRRGLASRGRRLPIPLFQETNGGRIGDTPPSMGTGSSAGRPLPAPTLPSLVSPGRPCRDLLSEVPRLRGRCPKEAGCLLNHSVFSQGFRRHRECRRNHHWDWRIGRVRKPATLPCRTTRHRRWLRTG